MFCSPCGTGSNYSSVSTSDCVTLCGAGISTFVVNQPSFTLSTLNVSSFNFNLFFPSSISTNVTNPYLNVNIPSTISTFIVNPCITLCGAGISTNITNSSLVVNISSPGGSTLGAVTIAGTYIDTFSRLTTETPFTLFTSHPAFTPQYESIGYQSTGTGTFFFDASNAIVLMSTTGAGASRAVRQTLEYQLYQPGKGHTVFMTWVPQYAGTFDTSVAVRCGIYDDYRDKNTPAGTTGPPPFLYASSIFGGLGQETNQPSMGHFFELSGNNWFVVERQNSPNNILNVIRVAQSNWNVDTLNPAFGNNPSGFTLQRSAEGLFWIERQWLGVGLVRMGVFNNGRQIVAHQFQNRGIKIPYTALNSLPIRYEIEKVTGGSSNFAATASICMASQIDGEYTPIGASFSLPANIIKPTTRVDQVLVPILLIRLQQQYCRASIRVQSFELYGKASGVFSIFKNPTITGSITWVNHPDPRSMAQYAVFANGVVTPTNTISGGQCIQTGFYDKRSTQAGSQSVADLINQPAISSDIKGKPDVYCIAMAGFADNDDVNAVCRWIEIV